MTKREPFAVVETGGYEYKLGDPVRIVVGGQPLSPTTDIEEAYRDAELINDALDKAVREAVEEFREIAAHIRALPTEPEGK